LISVFNVFKFLLLIPINASKPNEIAISIMSEIIASLRHHDFLTTELRDDWKLR